MCRSGHQSLMFPVRSQLKSLQGVQALRCTPLLNRLLSVLASVDCNICGTVNCRGAYTVGCVSTAVHYHFSAASDHCGSLQQDSPSSLNIQIPCIKCYRRLLRGFRLRYPAVVVILVSAAYTVPSPYAKSPAPPLLSVLTVLSLTYAFPSVARTAAPTP